MTSNLLQYNAFTSSLSSFASYPTFFRLHRISISYRTLFLFLFLRDKKWKKRQRWKKRRRKRVKRGETTRTERNRYAFQSKWVKKNFRSETLAVGRASEHTAEREVWSRWKQELLLQLKHIHTYSRCWSLIGRSHAIQLLGAFCPLREWNVSGRRQSEKWMKSILEFGEAKKTIIYCLQLLHFAIDEKKKTYLFVQKNIFIAFQCHENALVDGWLMCTTHTVRLRMTAENVRRDPHSTRLSRL